jgi:VCBS repeat protein
MIGARTVQRVGVTAAAALVLGGPLAGAARAQSVRPHFMPQAPFAVEVGFDAGRQALALADVNGDQRLDLVAIAPDESRVDVYLNLGNGSFDLVATPGLIEDLTPTSVAVADVASPFSSDRAGRPDGKPDIIVGGDGGEVEVLFGRNDGQFDPPESVVEPDATFDIIGLVVGDFAPGNGLDVALLDDDGVVLLCNDGYGNLTQCSGDEAIETGLYPLEIAGGDFNGDGRPDLAVLDGDEQLVWPLLGNGDASFAMRNPVSVAGEASDSPAVDLAVGRLDGDAIDDLVVVNFGEFLQYFGVALLGTSDGEFRVRPFILDFEATSLAVADFDVGANRASDVVVGYATGGPTISIGDGTGAFADPFGASGSGSAVAPALLLAGDLNGDGIADLLALSEDGSEVRVLLNGTGPYCTGDCNANGTVSVDELLRGVNILLGTSDPRDCIALDVDGNSRVTVNELVAAVAQDLAGCPAS